MAQTGAPNTTNPNLPTGTGSGCRISALGYGLRCSFRARHRGRSSTALRPRSKKGLTMRISEARWRRSAVNLYYRSPEAAVFVRNDLEKRAELIQRAKIE